MRLLQAVLSLALLISISDQLGMNSGPYDMEVEHVYACPDQGNNKGNIKISMYLGKERGPLFKKRLHRGSFSFPFDEDEMNRMELQAFFYQKKTNDFLLMYKHQDNFCDTMERIAPTTYRGVRMEFGLPPEGCLVPRGNYTFNDWEMKFILPTPMLEYGTYKVKMNCLVDKEVFVCFEGLVVVKRKY